jgi:hypothetical protein
MSMLSTVLLAACSFSLSTPPGGVVVSELVGKVPGQPVAMLSNQRVQIFQVPTEQVAAEAAAGVPWVIVTSHQLDVIQSKVNVELGQEDYDGLFAVVTVNSDQERRGMTMLYQCPNRTLTLVVAADQPLRSEEVKHPQENNKHYSVSVGQGAGITAFRTLTCYSKPLLTP